MENLTERQVNILKALIEEYIETAEPVGSSTLEKKYDLGVSPATIRNEMAELVRRGYLKQPHTSAGRAPSAKALKLYINELMRPEQLSVAEEVALKEKVWDVRHELNKLLQQTTRTLAEITHMLSLAAIEDEDFYYAGMSYILEMPEFYDIDVTRNLLMMLDDSSYWKNIFSKIRREKPISIILGTELTEDIFNPYSFIFACPKLNRQITGFIGVIGPKRLPYRRVIPRVRYYSRLLEEIGGW